MIVTCIGVAACSPASDGRTTQACTWTIGIMGAIEGEFAEFGAPPARAVEVAVDLANESGELACTLETHSENTEGDDKKAPASARRLVGDEDLVACVCGYFSGESLATGDVFGEAGVAMLSTAEKISMRDQGFETWFRLVTPVDRQATATGLYIRHALEARRVAIVTVHLSYSDEVARHVRAALGWRFKGPLVTLSPEESGVDDAAIDIRRMNPDLIFFAGYSPEAWEMFEGLRAYDLKMPYVTDGGAIYGPYEAREMPAGPVLLSCACRDVAEVEGAEPLVAELGSRDDVAAGRYAADAFDGANAVIDALRGLDGSESTEEVRAHVVDYLHATDGIDGLVKRYAWDDRGELITDNGDVWMWEWTKRRGFRMLGSVAEAIR
jgi:branched-chain amino acid transport system substrate-binding protein